MTIGELAGVPVLCMTGRANAFMLSVILFTVITGRDWLSGNADQAEAHRVAQAARGKRRSSFCALSAEQDCTAHSVHRSGPRLLSLLHAHVICEPLSQIRIFPCSDDPYGDICGLSSCLVLILPAVCCMQVEYPKEWPSFFHELLAMLPEGPQAVDMFCRILVAVDQDVVSLDIPRSSLP